MKRLTHKQRVAILAPLARANPNLSITGLEVLANIPPVNSASMFKKGTKARADEEASYARALAAYIARNK